VPGHVGIDGNEIADQLAEGGFLHPLMGPKAAFSVRAAVAWGAISGCTNRKRQECWQSKRGQR